MKKIKYTLAILLFYCATAFGQRPREITLDDDPFNFSDPAQFIVVVILPIVFIIAVIMINRSRRKRKRAAQSDITKNNTHQ